MKNLSNLIKLRNFMLLPLAFLAMSVFIVGCEKPVMSTGEEVSLFAKAGPIMPEVDIDRLLSAKSNIGIYQVNSGDVLELQMPTIMTAVSPELYRNKPQKAEPYLCRVTDTGTITLPILGEINVKGKTLATIEAEIVNLYYPRYIVTQPSVVCNVKEYHIQNVTVVGAVVEPGVYQMRSNEMSLVTLLMKAGGIVEDGASLITIKNPNRKYISYAAKNKKTNKIETSNENAETLFAEPTAAFTEPEIIEPEKTDFESLEVDLVFQPAGLNATDGTLVIQRGDEVLYADHINISSVNERASYIKGLEKVIGKKQAYIVSQALEQLAYQFAPAMAASSTVGFDAEEDELIGAADEYAPAKQNNVSDEECTYCNEDYIEQPFEQTEVIDNSSEVVFEQPQINDEQPSAVTSAVVEPIVLPVKGLNIPFIDVPLVEGDLVEVKRLNPSVFTVIGLAKNPGAFPYLPDMHYNLMQALGFAGGVDMIADPRFVSIYRQGGNGEVVSATFRIDKKFMAESYNVQIKPGDVISIDVTPRTRTNLLLHQILRLNFGVYVRPGLFNND